uniref:Uncharacterized protein n=1 Tax=Sphaerodactylus townsendi TaxID=933632 RepID=A0ACB8EZB2_9SAUR
MGKVQLFEIRLGDSRVVYSPGEPLTGTVTVRLAGSLQYRGKPKPGGVRAPPALPTCLPRGSGRGAFVGFGLKGRGVRVLYFERSPFTVDEDRFLSRAAGELEIDRGTLCLCSEASSF